jgi:hypothetical protein
MCVDGSETCLRRAGAPVAFESLVEIGADRAHRRLDLAVEEMVGAGKDLLLSCFGCLRRLAKAAAVSSKLFARSRDSWRLTVPLSVPSITVTFSIDSVSLFGPCGPSLRGPSPRGAVGDFGARVRRSVFFPKLSAVGEIPATAHER